MKFQLTLLNGATQFIFKLVPGVRRRTDIWVEEAVAVPTARFGGVKRHVRHLQQGVRVDPVLRRQRNPNTSANVNFITVDMDRLRNDLDDASGKRSHGVTIISLAN